MLTNSVPVMDLLCEHDSPHTDLIGLSGALRKLTRSFVGPQAVRAVASHFADKAILSVKGVTPGRPPHRPRRARGGGQALDGRARPHAASARRRHEVRRPALNAVVHVTEVGRVLAADVPPHLLVPIERAGVAVDRV